MNVNITFKGMEPSEAIKQYAIDRTSKLSKFVTPTTTLNVTLFKEKVRELAELTFNFRGQTYTAKTFSEDIYSSIDKMCDKVVAQLRRGKEKRVNHKAPGMEDTPEE